MRNYRCHCGQYSQGAIIEALRVAGRSCFFFSTAGVMNLVWVALIAAFVMIEKLAPNGALLGRLSGLASDRGRRRSIAWIVVTLSCAVAFGLTTAGLWGGKWMSALGQCQTSLVLGNNACYVPVLSAPILKVALSTARVDDPLRT